MKTHKIIDANNVLTAKQFVALGMSKGEYFANYDGTLDYAVPQDWLDSFAKWCESNLPQSLDHVTYDLIRSTTCWAYPESEPVTCCADVALVYRRYEKATVNY